MPRTYSFGNHVSTHCKGQSAMVTFPPFFTIFNGDVVIKTFLAVEAAITFTAFDPSLLLCFVLELTVVIHGTTTHTAIASTDMGHLVRLTTTMAKVSAVVQQTMKLCHRSVVAIFKQDTVPFDTLKCLNTVRIRGLIDVVTRRKQKLWGSTVLKHSDMTFTFAFIGQVCSETMQIV